MSEEEKREYEEAKLYLKHTGIDDFKWATEKILKLVDKQQKEIEELREEVKRQGNTREIEEEFIEKNYISKDQIREKMEEVKNRRETEIKKYQMSMLGSAIDILQELLEE